MTEGIAGFTAPVDQHRAPAAPAWRLAPAAVALGSLCLGAVALGHRSLSTSEAAAAAQAQRSLGSLASTIVHDDPGQAGHLLLLRLAATVRTDEIALRASSAIAVAVAAGLLVVLGTMMLGRLGGLVAGLALAANAGVVEASREARPYALGLSRDRRRHPSLRRCPRARRRLALDPVWSRRRRPAPHPSPRRISARGPRRSADGAP